MEYTKVVNGKIEKLKPKEELEVKAREKEWSDNENERLWHNIREQRNSLLAHCDWRVLQDREQSIDWLKYRQALRDITKQSDPKSVVWPIEPVE